MFTFLNDENYKGWDITLNWDNNDYLQRVNSKSNFLIKRKMVSVHLNGEKYMALLLKKLGILLIILVCMQSSLKDIFNYPDYFHYLQLVH